MADWQVGDLDLRELTVHWVRPWRWWRSIFRRSEWFIRVVHHRFCNHRCYCPVGSRFDLNVRVAGWGFVAWWSHYGGPVPCECEKAVAEYWGDDQQEKQT